MTKPNPANERIKREYFAYLKEAKRRDDATIDGVVKAIARFEESTKARDFKRFNREQAVAFKNRLGAATNARTGKPLSKSTVQSIIRDLHAFFFWLAHHPAFKTSIRYDDADYFNLSAKDVAIAGARRDKPVPSLHQVHRVLATMPANTVLDRRNRALIAFTAITVARVGALATFRLGHVNLAEGFVYQDARDVHTKLAKSFPTYFMDIGGTALGIVIAWIEELQRDHLWGQDDPLFPKTAMGLGPNGGFIPTGILRECWSTTQPINRIFRDAFASANLPYYNPHSFRDMMVQHGMSLDLTPEQMKAWSQNIGHSQVLTTFTSYGQVPTHRQGQLIRSIGNVGNRAGGVNAQQVATLEALLANLKSVPMTDHNSIG